MKMQGKRPGRRTSGKLTVEELISRYYEDLEKDDPALIAMLRRTAETEQEFEEDKIYRGLLLKTGRRERTIKLISTSLKIAASFALLCALVFVYQYRDQVTGYLTPAGLSGKTTAYGEIAALTFSDGTRLWLNSGSTVTYPSEFSGDSREITLVGEAYLDVASDPDRPFLIRTDGVTVKVLGTRFNVSAYREDKDISVAVVEGKVSVSANSAHPEKYHAHSNEVLVTRNQQAVYSRNNHSLSRGEDIDTESAIAWKEGKLIYQGTPLPEIVADLQRKYDVDIRTGKLAAGCLISANFSDEPLQKVLSILAELVNGTVSRTGDAYLIEGSGCRKE